MDKGKLKVLVMALKEIVEELDELEVYSDVHTHNAIHDNHVVLAILYSDWIL